MGCAATKNKAGSHEHPAHSEQSNLLISRILDYQKRKPPEKK